MMVIQKIRSQLKAAVTPEAKAAIGRFYKKGEDSKAYGVCAAAVHQIAKDNWKEVKDKPKKEIFALCETLFASDYEQEAWIASGWAYRLAKQYELADFKIFEGWISKYVNTWSKCDGFCNHAVGDLIVQFPRFLKDLKRWAKSPNLWLRRAAAVSLIVPARKGRFLKEVFEIADILLLDSEDLVQKGYGWLLKEASRRHQKEVFDYVVRRRAVMPRTALRYAIEKMPERLRKKAMKR